MTLIRRKLVQTLQLIALMLGSLIPAGSVLASAPQRPNIVVIIADDHGTDAIGAYGNDVIKTPAIDALARDGVRFDRAFGTASSCSPSRATILTGMQTHASGMYGLQQRVHNFAAYDDLDSLPRALSRAGYRTARVGKYHVAPESLFKFDLNLGERQRAARGELLRSPVEMARLSAQFIQQDAPFFLYFATADPHRSAPHGAVNKFGNREDGYEGAPPVVYDPAKVKVPSFLPDNAATRAEIAHYYQAISRVDAGVAEIVHILKEAGKYDDTIILYMSDNGMAFPGAKTTLYEPGVRLPLIIKAQNSLRRNQTETAMVSWVDIMPTLLDFAGAPEPRAAIGQDSGGRSFRGLLDGSLYTPRQQVIASQTFHEVQMYYPMRVVRTDRYKLIWNIAHQLPVRQAADLKNSATWLAAQGTRPDRKAAAAFGRLNQRPEFELYDLVTDPGELHNLASSRAHRAVLADLKTRLISAIDEGGDPWSPNWTGKGE